MTQHRVLVVDQHPVARDGTVAVLRTNALVGDVVTASCGDQALAVAREHQVALTVLDVVLGGPPEFDLIRRLKAHRPGMRVLVFTGHAFARCARQVMIAGAAGFLSKTEDSHRLQDAVSRVLTGDLFLPSDLAEIVLPDSDQQLTDRECDVLDLYAGGRNADAIAAALGASKRTVEGHLSAIKHKAGVTSRWQLTTYAHEIGLGLPRTSARATP